MAASETSDNAIKAPVGKMLSFESHSNLSNTDALSLQLMPSTSI